MALIGKYLENVSSLYPIGASSGRTNISTESEPAILSICLSILTRASQGLSSGGRNATCIAQTNTADVAFGLLMFPVRYVSLDGGSNTDLDSNCFVPEVRVDGADNLLV